MNTKQPATPLPWEASIAGNSVYGLDAVGQRTDCVARTSADREQRFVRQDASYIAHACNSYPRLVEKVRGVMGLVQLLANAHDDQATKNHRYVDADALLRELGESE